MDLLFIRHAIAAPLGDGIERDTDRPLSVEGERRFKEVAERLTRFAPRPRAILTSPHLRARQTAQIAAQAWGHASPVVVPALADGDWDGIRAALGAYADGDTVALVGHETWISSLTADLLGSRRHQAFDYRKGGVALIRIEKARPTRGTLRWFIPPRVLRKL